MRAGVAAPPLSLSHLQAGPQGVDVLHGGREEAWAECGPAPRQPSSRTQRAAKKKKECGKGERGGGGAAGKPLSPSRLDKNAHALSSRESLRLPSHTFHTRTHAHAHHGCWLAPILGAGERERERAGNREREGGTARARPPPAAAAPRGATEKFGRMRGGAPFRADPRPAAARARPHARADRLPRIAWVCAWGGQRAPPPPCGPPPRGQPPHARSPPPTRNAAPPCPRPAPAPPRTPPLTLSPPPPPLHP